MRWCIVQSAKHYVFERESALVTEVVLAQKFDDFFDWKSLFGWHHRESQFRNRCMKAYCHVTFALVEKAFQSLAQTDGRYGYTLRTPLVPVISRENLERAEHLVEVVHRLALPHEHDVRKALMSRHRIYLIEDFGSRKARLKALLSSHAEATVHLASNLRRHTQRCTVAVGNVNCLDIVASRCSEQIFRRSVNRVLTIYGRAVSDAVAFSQKLTVLHRQVGHLVNFRNLLIVHPRCYLLCSERRHAQRCNHLLQFGKCHS